MHAGQPHLGCMGCIMVGGGNQERTTDESTQCHIYRPEHLVIWKSASQDGVYRRAIRSNQSHPYFSSTYAEATKPSRELAKCRKGASAYATEEHEMRLTFGRRRPGSDASKRISTRSASAAIRGAAMVLSTLWISMS